MKMSNWKVNLSEARKLRKRGIEMLFDRVTLLVECYDDAEFMAYVNEEGSNVIEYLDTELDDTAATFLTLKAVIEKHPTKDEWVKHNVRELIAMVLVADKEAKAAEGDETHAARQSWKERAIKAEAEVERLRARVAYLEETLEKFIKAGSHQEALAKPH